MTTRREWQAWKTDLSKWNAITKDGTPPGAEWGYYLPEQEEEDVCVIDICKADIQDPKEDLRSQIDVSHRIGRREDGKTQPVITRNNIQINQRNGMEMCQEFGIPQNKEVKVWWRTTKDKETCIKL